MSRNNLDDFTDAANELCKVFQKFLAGDADLKVSGLTREDLRLINGMLEAIKDSNGDFRHTEWLDAIKGDNFGFGKVELLYQGKGHGSWKHNAIDTVAHTDQPNEKFPYDASFLTSDWKSFHDAAKAHRLSVIDDILPRYGICAA